MHHTCRRTILFATLAGLAASSAAWAQVVDPVFQRLDSNRDGRISLAEHASAQQATFKRMDSNHDGKLTAQEMAAVRRAMTQVEIAAEEREAMGQRGAKGAAAPAKGASVEDAAVAQALFERLDANHDGVVSTAEMQAAHTRRPPAAAPDTKAGLGKASLLDANHDGAVSTLEHAGIARARFARMDANKDGFVTSQEWTTAHAPPAPPAPAKKP